MATPRKNNPADYYRPIPIDFLILDVLPDKGQLGGVHWKGRRVKDVYAEILETQNGVTKDLLKQTAVTARIRSMSHAGYVESFASVSGAGLQIWARTAKGVELLSRRDEILGLNL